MKFSVVRRGYYSWLVLFVGFALFGAVLAYLLQEGRTSELKNQTEWLSTLASVVDRNIESQLVSVNRTLDSLHFGRAQLSEHLAQLVTTLPGVRTLSLIDATGRVRESNNADMVGTLVDHDAEFVQARDHPRPGVLVIAQPSKGAQGVMEMVASKVVLGADGAFGGLAKVEFDTGFYQTLLDSVKENPQTKARLYHGEGALFLGEADGDLDAPATEMGRNSDFQKFRASGSERETLMVGEGDAARMEVFALVRTDDLALNAPLVVEIERSLVPTLGRLARNEQVAGLLFVLTAASLVFLVVFLQRRDDNHHRQVVEYTELIQDSSLRVQLATEAAHLGVWEWRPESNVLTWDAQMFLLYGRDRDAPQPTMDEWWTLVLPEDRVTARALLEKASEDHKACHRVYRIARPDGEVRWIQCNARYYAGNHHARARFIGINEDITQRVQSRVVLMNRERFLRLVTETTHSMIAYFTAAEECRFTNAGYAARHGRRPEQMEGLLLREVLGDELYRQRRPIISEVLSGLPRELQTEAVDSLGQESYLWIHYTPDVHEGVVQGFFILVDDITELKRAQELVEAQQGKLILNARMAQMGELLNLISHQWRQPLTVISALVGNIQLRSQLGQLDSDYLLPKLERITQTVQFLSSTIESFRAFYAPSNRRARTDLVAMTQQALDILSPVLQKNSFEVRFHATDVPLWAPVLQAELMQVVLEILGNARSALSKLSSPGWIDIAWRSEGGRAILTIANNGGAIADDVMPRIFQPYFTTKDDGTGTGMGLYMAKVIVESHHQGVLRASSEGEVTRFELELPLEEPKP